MPDDYLGVDVTISTHTPLARRDGQLANAEKSHMISTHTPLARRDVNPDYNPNKIFISTHTPLARRDGRAV